MYPVMINIKDKRVVMIGGGRVALRKLKTLLKEGARVTVISPEIHPGIPIEEIEWLSRPYQKGDLEGAKLVLTCTDDQDVNNQVMADAVPSQLVNNTGDKYYSDFYNVAIAQASDFSVMISTNGLSAVRAKEVRSKLEKFLELL
ncbi:siroheme synthase [Streptococcus varani]|uniref:precorrin-2 dehydrogenase n=1 Tax=Streptococcus varani TaxID=1608583 RepID=A0A0E4H5U4_9STRE|nr:bifunctional precorrin-2 dehydrogenase/sirohydrochlorin ferrochelatase [Streptococcus varani]CQR25618.1 siroheme synthase [Streptococcus varani]